MATAAMAVSSPSVMRSAASQASGVSGLKFVRDVTRVFEMSEQLHHSTRSSVHRARRRQDGLQGANVGLFFDRRPVAHPLLLLLLLSL